MGKQLAGRNALVTGSTSGLGQGMAEAFAREGANVALNGFGEAAAIEALRQRLEREHGVKAAYVPADMARPAEIRDMVARAQQALGPLDILVNNAGIQHVAPVEAFPEERWDAIIAINLSAVFHATKAVLPSMKARGGGRIINIASAHGLIASPNKSAYVAAKHGVVGFTKACALEGAESGVRVNAICPGFVLTPLVQKQVDALAAQHGVSQEKARELILAPQPTRQFVTIEQVAAMAVYLAGEAAAQVNGASFSIDGGWTAR